jgi:hypothetical protein
MKTQNRNFVVEYKGARKRGPSQPNSIWGDIDLISAAKSVEADGLLPTKFPSVETTRLHEAVAHPSTSEPTLSSSNVEQTDVAEAAEEIAPAGMSADDHPAVPWAGAQEHLEPEEDTAPPRKTRGKDLRPRRRQAQPNPVQEALLDTENDLSQKLELEQLDAENRSLKRQLSAKLRDENKALKSMLRRLR